MSKFGEIIESKIPVLIDFHTDWNEQSIAMSAVVQDVALELGDNIKVMKIDIDKNQELADALRIKSVPTLMIYRAGSMIWRNAGEMSKEDIVAILKEQIEWHNSLS